ncbi:hypothetical protein C2S51_002451, partial [Perilla frutescens var. frutescens]
MVEPPKSRVESLLQAAVQTAQWTYSLFWQLCPQKGTLVWSDGYYNGAIKTRKTVQPTEEVAEEVSTLQRSQQLRELYESLSAGETSHQPRRPSASLSPEDLTESEWFYLMCVSFSFPPGVGLPGKAYADRQHIWLTRANEADSKLFSRTILAKTVLCIPLLDGVVELGTTEKVEEDIGVIERVKSLFSESPLIRAAKSSEHSTSNPPNPSASRFYSRAEEEEEEEEEDELTRPLNSAVQPLMQLDMCMSAQDIRVGSPDNDSSNNLDSDFRLQPTHSAAEEDSQYYSQTVSSILENQTSNRWSKYSAFCKWTGGGSSSSCHRHNLLLDGASQWVLKYVLLTVPLLHSRATPTPQLDDLINGNHVMAERRRREKLNQRFIVLRSMVPFITKMDKASILADTIDYLKQLKKRIQELESKIGDMKKRKIRMSDADASVEVSIIESDALVEIECLQKPGLLSDFIQALRGLGIQITTVQSSINTTHATLTAHFRAK